MRWTKFTGQKLETGDILWTDDGLAFVDSGYTTGEPSRISSIPENWTFFFENGDIHKIKRQEGSAFISNSGKYYVEKRYGGKCAGQILYMCRLKKPILKIKQHV